MKDYENLKSLLAQTGGVVVAYSGGVDSTLVAKAATDALGDKALCALVESELMPKRELADAAAQADSIGLTLVKLDMDALGSDIVACNSPDRCYHCKKAVFQKLLDLGKERGLGTVVDGGNTDDDADYRPGHKALRELGIRSPLKELGIDKKTVREMSHELGLPTWNKPARACLASRVPYGTRLEADMLRRIDQAEEVLSDLGFEQYRVRHHGKVARVEVLPEDMARAMSEPVRTEIVTQLKRLGYTYVALDMAGYKTGSMNEALKSG